MRYDVMELSNTKSDRDTLYFDPLTVPLNEFQYTRAPFRHVLKKPEIQRPDIFLTLYYGTPIFNDLVWILNGIPFAPDVSPGETLLLPSKIDLQNFLSRHRT